MGVIFGTKFLWDVLSIILLKSIRRPGISVNTHIILSIMAFIKTRPISNPILKCINIIAPKPEMVVRQLPDISGIALESAVIAASLGCI